ncbi:hypothetical protein GF324_01920 [bacterium]|nr:hypothetical protein [bacterium]
MGVRNLNARLWTFAAFLAGLVFLGCDSDPSPPSNSIDVDTRLIMPDGRTPVWFPDGTEMLATYRAGTGEPGIYRVRFEGGYSEAIYTGAHNHDYTLSSDGSRAAFSVPGPNGGVRVVDFGGSTDSMLPGGRNPGFVRVNNRTALVAEDADGSIVVVDLTNEVVDYTLVDGRKPLPGPDETPYIAYLHPSVRGGFRLRAIHVGGGEERIPLIEDVFVGNDFSWAPDGVTLYASVLTDTTVSTIVECSINFPSSYSPVVNAAVDPTVDATGTTLLASHLTGASTDYLLYHDLGSGLEEQFISDGREAVCAPDGKRALYTTDEGIWLAEW